MDEDEEEILMTNPALRDFVKIKAESIVKRSTVKRSEQYELRNFSSAASACSRPKKIKQRSRSLSF